MQMTEKHKEIAKLLWDFDSLKVEQVLNVCGCTENDINFLIANKSIKREKNSKILKHSSKNINPRNIAAFDVVMEYLDRNPDISKAKYPINVSMKIQNYTYDIIAIKEIEIDSLFEKIDKISKGDKLIIIVETKQYIRKIIKTNKPCLICTYPPLEIVDKVN